MNEMEEIRQRHQENQRKRAAEQLEKNAPAIQSFLAHCVELGIEIDESNISYIGTIGVVATKKGLLKAISPVLETNKDGLYDLKELRGIFEPAKFPGTGLLKGNHFGIMAHPYFRRSMHPGANWQPRFIEEFWKVKLPGSELLIALDPDRLKVNMDDYGYIEFDTWFGASFYKEIHSIKDGLSQLRPPAGLSDFELEFLFGGAYSLQIKWSTKGKLKAFQAEAFLGADILFELEDDLWHPSRYIHAQYDLEKEEFVHFDGAIHFYQPSDYLAMRDSDLDHNLKFASQIKAPSKKIFCINDQIPVQLWIDLTTHFFPHNPLMIEYFEGKYPENIRETLAAIQKANSQKPDE